MSSKEDAESIEAKVADFCRLLKATRLDSLSVEERKALDYLGVRIHRLLENWEGYWAPELVAEPTDE